MAHPSAIDVRAAMLAYADRCQRKAESINATAATMHKPGEQRTKRDLQRSARTYDEAVWNLRRAEKAMADAPLEESDA